MAQLAAGASQNTKEPLSQPAEIEVAVGAIRQSATEQVERIQAYVDGAILAVEQVQDKRLSLLKKQLEATASDALFAGAMTALLESSIAGKILVSITRGIVKPMLQTNFVFQLIPSVRNRSNLAALVRQCRGPNRFSLYVAAIAKAGGRYPEINTLRRYAAALGRGSPKIEENLVAGQRPFTLTTKKGAERTILLSS